MNRTPRVDTLLDMLLASRVILESCTPECPTMTLSELTALAKCSKCQAWILDALIMENDRQAHQALTPESEPCADVETKPFRRQNPPSDFDNSD